MKIPDTQLAKDSALLMRSAAPRSLYNHCLRTFVLGVISATKRRIDIDVEMAFHASILHDLALTETYHGDLRVIFEENSSNFAAAFARVAGASDERADNVYRAILLHAGKAGLFADLKFVELSISRLQRMAGSTDRTAALNLPNQWPVCAVNNSRR